MYFYTCSSPQFGNILPIKQQKRRTYALCFYLRNYRIANYFDLYNMSKNNFLLYILLFTSLTAFIKPIQKGWVPFA